MKGFDPYHKWLGIPPEEQPPNHYRLLGLNVLESDLEVIEAAADRQMAYLQSCASGEHVEASQNLLNRVSTARVCLLNSDMKAAYDAKLPRLTRRLLSNRQVKTYVIVALLGVTVLTIFLLHSWSPNDFKKRGPVKSLDDWNSIVVDVTAGVKKPGRYKVVFQYKSGRDRIGVRRVQINTGRYPPQARLAASAF
jgi:hypothetical protein